MEHSLREGYPLDMRSHQLDAALALLGALLEERGQSAAILVIGGSSLLLHGWVDRPTADVDVLGFAEDAIYTKAERLPEFLAAAADDVGAALGLDDGWLNCGPAGLVDFGLPEGLAERVSVHRYGGLEVHLPGRHDLICFKLYAIVDTGPRSKHVTDLRALAPSRDELVGAARWARTQDDSTPFLGELRAALAMFGVEVDDGDL